MTPIEKDIAAFIKHAAKSQRITQQQMAKKLNVSVVTIKRWYAGKGLNISNLKRICDYLGLCLVDLFSMSATSCRQDAEYTLEQEHELAQNPRLLAFFDLLIGGHSPRSIQKQYNLKDHYVTSLLTSLDKMGLIDLYAKHKFTLKISGEPRWMINGPLVKMYRQHMIEQFLGTHEKSKCTFLIHDYSNSDARYIKRKLDDLLEYMHAANRRSKYDLSDSESFGAYFSFKKFEWDIRNCLKT